MNNLPDKYSTASTADQNKRPSGPSTELDIPAWDFVGRYLRENRRVNQNMISFWDRLDRNKRKWMGEVRGAFGHTIAFTFIRATNRYAEPSDIEDLINEIQVLNGDTIAWYSCICDNRIDLYGRTNHGFAVCIFTPWDSQSQLPSWVHR